jgi:hypothetical protein
MEVAREASGCPTQSSVSARFSREARMPAKEDDG